VTEDPALAILFPNFKNRILLKLEMLDIFIVSSFPTNSCVLFQGELVWLEAMKTAGDYIAKRKHEDCTFQCQFLLACIHLYMSLSHLAEIRIITINTSSTFALRPSLLP